MTGNVRNRPRWAWLALPGLLLLGCGSPVAPGPAPPVSAAPATSPAGVDTASSASGSAGGSGGSDGPSASSAGGGSGARGDSAAGATGTAGATGRTTTANPGGATGQARAGGRAGPPPGPGGQNPKPGAPGSPLRIPLFNIKGIPYADNKDYVETSVRDACPGRALCVRLRLTGGGAAGPNPKCVVDSIDQPNPIYAGGTITFGLSDDCGDAPPTTSATRPAPTASKSSTRRPTPHVTHSGG